MSLETKERHKSNGYDYIDFQDIREYNHKRKTYFSPMEQAVLVYHSTRIPVEQKLNIWRELFETFTESELQQVRYMMNRKDRANKEILRYTIESFESALSRGYNSEQEGQLFEARFWECDYSDERHVVKGLFTKFDEAQSFLAKEKTEYIEDEWLSQCKTKTEIMSVKIGEPYARSGDIFVYNNEMDMIRIYPEEHGSESDDLYSVCLRIPLPFKKGDLVKTNDCDEVMYAVMNYDYEWDVLRPWDKDGDASHMYCMGDVYCKQDAKGGCPFFQGEFEYLSLEYCDEKELPEEQKALLVLQEGYRGEVSLGEMLRKFWLDVQK